MAKKKIETAETPAAVIESQSEASEKVKENVEEAVVPTSAPEANVVEEAELNDEVSEEHEDEVARPTQDFSAIPPQAVDYLKRHPEVDAIYIDKFGGMFSKNTPQVFAKDAVLYHNPYFKQ